MVTKADPIEGDQRNYFTECYLKWKTPENWINGTCNINLTVLIIYFLLLNTFVSLHWAYMVLFLRRKNLRKFQGKKRFSIMWEISLFLVFGYMGLSRFRWKIQNPYFLLFVALPRKRMYLASDPRLSFVIIKTEISQFFCQVRLNVQKDHH